VTGVHPAVNAASVLATEPTSGGFPSPVSELGIPHPTVSNIIITLRQSVRRPRPLRSISIRISPPSAGFKPSERLT
jgi:hypothetical protein